MQKSSVSKLMPNKGAHQRQGRAACLSVSHVSGVPKIQWHNHWQSDGMGHSCNDERVTQLCLGVGGWGGEEHHLRRHIHDSIRPSRLRRIGRKHRDKCFEEENHLHGVYLLPLIVTKDISDGWGNVFCRLSVVDEVVHFWVVFTVAVQHLSLSLHWKHQLHWDDSNNKAWRQKTCTHKKNISATTCKCLVFLPVTC